MNSSRIPIIPWMSSHCTHNEQVCDHSSDSDMLAGIA